MADVAFIRLTGREAGEPMLYRLDRIVTIFPGMDEKTKERAGSVLEFYSPDVGQEFDDVIESFDDVVSMIARVVPVATNRDDPARLSNGHVPISRVPGLWPQTRRSLERAGVVTTSQLLDPPLGDLVIRCKAVGLSRASLQRIRERVAGRLEEGSIP